MAERAVAVLVAAAVAGCSGHGPTGERLTTAVLPADQQAASALVSAYRRRHGLSGVGADATLQAVAQAQADAMASADVLSHTVAGSLPARLDGVGRGRGASVENVSAGYPSLGAALGGWQRSPAHDRNLLDPSMRRIGVAGASAPATRFKTFWALVMSD